MANNKGERQKLYGIQLLSSTSSFHAIREGARLVDETGARAGVVTSLLPGAPVGLAYVRKTVANPLATTLRVEGEGVDVAVKVVEMPYLTRSEEQSASGASAKGKQADAAASAEKAADAAAAKAAEEERKAAKLEEMRKRLEAFQKKQAPKG